MGSSRLKFVLPENERKSLWDIFYTRCCCVDNLISCFSKDVSKILRMMRFWDPCRIFSMLLLRLKLLLVVACCHLAQHSRMKMKRKTQKDDCKSPREKNDTFFEGVRVTRQQEFHVKSYYIWQIYNTSNGCSSYQPCEKRSFQLLSNTGQNIFGTTIQFFSKYKNESRKKLQKNLLQRDIPWP